MLILLEFNFAWSNIIFIALSIEYFAPAIDILTFQFLSIFQVFRLNVVIQAFAIFIFLCLLPAFQFSLSGQSSIKIIPCCSPQGGDTFSACLSQFVWLD
jgi:hypothetical protein